MSRRIFCGAALKLPLTWPCTLGLTSPGRSRRPKKSCRKAWMGCSRAVSDNGAWPSIGIDAASAGPPVNSQAAQASAHSGRSVDKRTRRDIGRFLAGENGSGGLEQGTGRLADVVQQLELERRHQLLVGQHGRVEG